VVPRAVSREQFERLIEELIRDANNHPRSQAHEEYDAKIKRKVNAWRECPPSSVVWGEWEAADPKAIELHKAFVAFHETGDAASLTAVLRSPEALQSVYPKSIARLRELLDARREPRTRGTPGGAHLRWRSARQVAANIVERRKEGWRIEHNRNDVPADVTEKIVDEVIEFMKTWDAAKRRRWLRFKPLSKVSVLALLREPKTRRL
jgi:hypothetical protein